MAWYLRYPLSYRDSEELLLERGLEVGHSTVNRWVLAYALLIGRRLRPLRKPTAGRWVGARGRDLRPDPGRVPLPVRAIDKHGETVDFLLTAMHDLNAAKRFLCKMLKHGPLLSPARIRTDGDGDGTYPGRHCGGEEGGPMACDPVHHVTRYLQQRIESDHFRLK